MPPLRLLLVRHGRTAWNVERRILGRTDLPLDDEGRAQAVALAAALPRPDAVWSSPLRRALETAAVLGDARVEHGLAEMDQGELDGLAANELVARHGPLMAAWNTDPTGVRLPGGETLDEVQARGLDALRRIAAAHRAGESVAVVSHQLLLSAVLCGLHGEPLSAWRRYTHPNCAYTVVAWEDAPRVLTLRACDHLPG